MQRQADFCGFQASLAPQSEFQFSHVREPLCQTNKKETDNKTTTIVTKREEKKGGEKRGRKETPWFWSSAAGQLLPSVCSDRF